MGDVHVFSAKIYKVGIIRFVDVSVEVSRVIGGGAAHVSVIGEVEGLPLRSTLVSRGKGCYRLAIHGEIRKKLGVDAGAVVEITIERDEESREPLLPPALVLALRNSPKAQAAFRKMTTALRRQVVRYLTSVRQQATLERRVATFVRRLEARANQRQARTRKRE
jgi:bifunctional DNA-binding transcriptional regulator/antitoxin component of YhaV-PrlF toxin-antitoxin module